MFEGAASSSVLRGITSVNLDAKGRMALPARFRDVWEGCAGQLVVTVDDREKCLLLYPLPEWEVVQRKLETLSNVRRGRRRLQRLLVGHATDLEVDGSGRILLPPMLREHAQLKKKVVLLGQSNKFEIWAEELWQTRVEEYLKESADMDDDDDFTGISV
jgi:MraZ protein